MLFSKKPRLLLFEQKSGPDYNVLSSTLDVRQSSRTIVHLDTVSSGSSSNEASGTVLLAIHEDGEISCYTKTLDQEIWTARAIPEDQWIASTRVEYACVVSIAEAQKALMNGREDLLESLGNSNNPDADMLLLLFTSSANDKTLNLRLLKINFPPSNPHKLNTREQKPLHVILSVPILGSDEQDTKGSQIFFHAASAILYQKTPKALVTYDLSGCTPRVGQKISTENGELTSFVRISKPLVVMASDKSISVLDLRYKSYQGQLKNGSQPQKLHPLSEIKKELQTQGVSPEPITLLSYNASLDIVVGLQGHELQAFQLATAIRSDGSRKRKRDGLLIDSLGRGATASKQRLIPTKSSNDSAYKGLSFIAGHVDELWKKQRVIVDECFAKGNMRELERVLFSDAGKTHNDADATRNCSQTKTNSQKVDYVISKTLEIEDDGPAATNKECALRRLRVAESIKRIPHCMFSQGCLSDHQVERALKREGRISNSDRIKTGSVIQALAQWDRSLRTLAAYVKGPSPFTADETIHALRYAVTNNEPSGSSKSMKLLTYGDEHSDVNVEESTIRDSDPRADQNSLNVRGDGQSVTERIFEIATRRLYSCPSLEVSSALRIILSTSEIRLLVNMLRIQLAQSGWLTPYVEEGSSARSQARQKGSQLNSQILVVAHLLGCAVDSIGTGGWIMGSSMADELTETAETIAYMKAEISAALEGIEEATYLKGMLGEMLLCGKSFRNSHAPNPKGERKRTTIVSLGVGEENTLPLGLKLPQDISKYKVGAGGELIRRSARDIGRLKSRMVPKYSFERIII
ncbi:MAG: hypothetical protein Q9195_007398 [Heterodermia aff. obscurata]